MGIPTILLYLSMQTELNEVHSFLQFGDLHIYFAKLFVSYMVVWGIAKSLLKIMKCMDKAKRMEKEKYVKRDE